MQPKWSVSVHSSHRGRVQSNIAIGAEHAGIATEDGSESHNVIDGNMVMGVTNGHGYWLNGLYSTFTNNIAAACRGSRQRRIISSWGVPPRPVFA